MAKAKENKNEVVEETTVENTETVVEVVEETKEPEISIADIVKDEIAKQAKEKEAKDAEEARRAKLTEQERKAEDLTKKEKELNAKILMAELKAASAESNLNFDTVAGLINADLVTASANIEEAVKAEVKKIKDFAEAYAADIVKAKDAEIAALQKQIKNNALRSPVPEGLKNKVEKPKARNVQEYLENIITGRK